MLNSAPALLAGNANHWFNSDKKSSFLVRNLGDKTRALLSDRYRTFDNAELAEMAVPALIQSGARIESCEVTERRFYLKAVTERISFDVGVGDVVQAGLVISNSEVGAGALSVEPLLFRLKCLNGMISSDSGMRRTHLGGVLGSGEGVQEFFKDSTLEAADRAFWMQVRDLIGAFFNPESFRKIVERFRAARGEPVTGNPMKVVEVLQKKFSLTEAEKDGVLTSFLTGGDINRFGIVNALTFTAQGVESYDRSTELERFGGQVLELSPRDWSLVAEAH
jgi:hypothetical protein